MSPDRICRGRKARPAGFTPAGMTSAGFTQTGFTLIELLVVIFIISLLVALTLTIVPKVKRAVYGAETQAQLSALSNAIQQYYNDYKSYPGPLANNQLDWSADTVTGNEPVAYTFKLAGSATLASPYNPSTANTFGDNITGAQNLVLGLLGGLELTTSSGAATGFVYNPQDIFSDGQTPAPRGPASLNVTNPKRQQSYIQVKAGDLSTPNSTYNGGAGASFVDSSGDLVAANKRSPADAMIPVFLDKYSDPLPILYYRTNVGGNGIVGMRNSATLGGSQMTYTAPGFSTVTYITPQYDLLQNLPYVSSRIGTTGTLSNNPNSYHGLQGITASSNATSQLLIYSATPTSPSVDSIDNINLGQNVPSNSGSNGLAYFKDPTLNSTTYDNTTSNTHLGVARQKDGFLLISAGPDRLYGTHDDVVFPGPLQP